MMFKDLPQELELEILVRVPATSLTQLKSTCKRWYALLRERFIEKNLGKGARQFILKKDDGVYSVSINLDNSFEFTCKLTSLEDSEHVVINTIHQCDGLFLFTTKDNRHWVVNKLVVWNPCTGQTRWIQPSNRNYKNDQYFLGYGNNNKSFQNYKILRSSHIMNEFEVYDFNSESWRLLDGLTHDIWFIRSRGVSLKGSIYWVAWDRCNKPFTSKYLLRFDFKREIFERLSLPFQVNYFDGDFSLSVVREEKLSVFLRNKYSESFEAKIWVTDTKMDEAKDAACIQYFLLYDFRESWSMMDVVSFESFLVDEETKKVVCCGRDVNDKNRIVIYIVGGDQNLHICKQIHGEVAQGQYDYYQLPRRPDDYWPYDRPDDYIDLLVSYVPSLVHIQQVKEK